MARNDANDANPAEASNTDQETTSSVNENQSGRDAMPENDESSSESEGPSKRKKIIVGVAIAVILIAAFFGVRMWLHSRHYVSTDDAFIDAQIVRIAPQIAGRIETLAVQANQHVSAGQLLTIISPDTIQPQVAQGQANIQDAQAQLTKARSAATTAAAACRAAQAQVSEPRAELAKASDQLRRLLNARDLDPATVAAIDIEQAQASVNAARAALSAAQSSAQQACSQQQAAQSQIDAAKAGISSARAGAQGNQVTLDQTRITAPLAGTIANLTINTGSYVSPGGSMMALVPERIFVTANFKETDLHRMKVGDPVTVTVDAYPDLELKAKIASFQRAAGQAFSLLPPQNATGNFVKVVQRVPVRIEFTQAIPEGVVLGPGMSVVPSVRVQ